MFPHVQAMQGNSASRNHFSGHGMPFNAPFIGAPNGNQMFCGQNLGFPVNKDVTLTNPLLVNLLQSDISAGNFGVNNKQNNIDANKLKKKTPWQKKNSRIQTLQILTQLVWRRLISSHYLENKEFAWKTQALNRQNFQVDHQALHRVWSQRKLQPLYYRGLFPG